MKVMRMDSAFDVMQLLKRFGIIVYVGDREADLQLMEAELKELYAAGLIRPDEFQQAMLILKRELNTYKNSN
jgi:uncharacterized protein YqgQ